jgi:hypothetical protein
VKTATFKDCEGTEWKLNITAGSLLKACRGTGISLADLTNMNIELEVILGALPFFCEKQIRERSLSHEEFLDRFGWKELEGLMEVFTPAVGDAFPDEEDMKVEGKTTAEEGEEAPLDLGSAKTS